MPRRERRDGPGTLHHVMNRGIARRTIFLDDSDRRFFLARVAWEVKRRTVRLYSFALMETHYHLLVLSMVGQLSAAMRRIQNRHTRRFNRRACRDGPLFKDRFKSIAVEDNRYWSVLRDYIENNPVDAGIVSKASEYPFGSAYHRNRSRSPRWLVSSVADGYDPDGPRGSVRDQSWIIERACIKTATNAVHWPDIEKGEDVRAWVLERSLLADGHDSMPPAAAPEGLLFAIEERQRLAPIWQVRPLSSSLHGWPILKAGLLRCLCSLSVSEVAATLETSMSTVRNHVRYHIQLAKTSAEYVSCCSGVAETLLSRVIPRNATPLPGTDDRRNV